MTIPSGIIASWPGTAASIPAGWSRYTALDGRYPKGILTGTTAPGTTGGAASHTHAAPDHAHTLSHTHSGNVGNDAVALGGAATTGVGTAFKPHNHGYIVPTSTDALNAGSAVTWDSATADPSYYTVVWMQSDGTPTGLPASALCHWNSQTAPSGFSQHAASKGLFLKGAAAGTDGGGTGGGTHSHTQVTTHAHVGNHTHPAGATGLPGTTTTSSAGGVSTPTNTHTHVLPASGAATETTGGTASPANIVAGMDPPYTTLLCIQNTGSTAQPVGIICLWAGALASVPAGWTLCTGSGGTPNPLDKFVKTANALTDVGLTGGALGHTHAAGASHTHTEDTTHTHTVGAPSATGSLVSISGGGGSDSDPGHTHSSSTAAVPPAATTGAATALTTAIADSRPLYTELAYVQYGGPMTTAITSPSGAITTSQPTVAWTITAGRTQSDYRVQITDATDVSVIWDSGRTASATQSFTLPAGVLQTGNTYHAHLTVNATSGENAVAPVTAFTTSWTQPTALGTLSAAPVGGT